MFKIPQWEDDVPKSKVEFGKTSKANNNKNKSVSESPQKPANQQKSPSEPLKTQKQSKKFKNKQANNNNQPKENGYNKLNKQKKFSPHKNKETYKKPGHKTDARSGNNSLSETSNNTTSNVVSNKKKRPKKRKLEGATEKQQPESKNESQDVSTPSKPKRKKPNDEELAQEGSILFEKKSKKKKNENHVVNSENAFPSRGSKLDQKKEKLRQMLQVQSNRNQINVSGNNLRQRMLERLKSAQFRFLNEKLYTTSGSEAQQLFQSDPDAFQTYHQGYQQQVKKWPVNPLDLIVKRISKMPKSHVIADMGCGEAALSRRVQQAVRSFDLVAGAPGVEACDMAHTPLLTGAADAAVYCLALMGTDLTQYLLEANRVLKTGGHLLIAEVESRFDKVDRFVEEVERLGFKLKNLDESNKVFFFLEFVKVRDPPAKKGKLPAITLKPCLYKRR